jgi:processive 1,2-diacylglycerol beta-glucosyltransferase
MKAAIRAAHAGDERLTVLDFTDKVSLYLAASDLLFTKPGGLSSTEAAVRGIPTLHTKPIPGWEQENIEFFRKHGMSDFGDNTEALVTKALFLLANPHRGEEMVENQRKNINPFAAKDIVDFLLNEDKRA